MNNFFLHFSVHFFMHIDCECFLYFGWIVPSLYIISEGLKWFGSFGNSVVSRRLYGSIAMSSCFHVHPYRPMLITLHIRRLRFHMPWLCVCVFYLFVCFGTPEQLRPQKMSVCFFLTCIFCFSPSFRLPVAWTNRPMWLKSSRVQNLSFSFKTIWRKISDNCSWCCFVPFLNCVSVAWGMHVSLAFYW